MVAVRSEDVMLTVGKPPRSSARNVLPGRVVSLQEQPMGILVTVDVGRPLLAAVTPAAVKDLDLRSGCEVFVLLKARALRGVALHEQS